MSATNFLLTLNGSYRSGPAAGSEIWQTGVRLALGTGSGEPDMVGTLNSIDIVAANIARTETDWTIDSNWTTEMGVSDFDPGDFLNDQAGPAAAGLIASAAFASDVQIDSLKLYPINTTGHVEPAPPYAQGSPAVLEWTSATGRSGTGSQGLPPQCSVVASLRTQQTGRKGRGRMYLPPCPVSYMSNLVIGSANVSTISTLVKTFLEGLRVSAGVGGVWCWPIVTGAPYAKYAAVSRLVVDNVVDTQQRRRRAIPVTATSTAVDPFA